MIVYNKLKSYLEQRGMKYIDLQRQIGFSPSVTAKFQKNRPVNTESINKICEYLQCQPSDIMEWIPDEEGQQREREKIQRQIEELREKLGKI